MWRRHGRAKTGCGAHRQHKTFLRIRVRKDWQVTRSLTYNLTYSRDSLRSPSAHHHSRTRVSMGATEDPVARRRAAAVSRETARAAQRNIERSAVGIAGRPGARHDAG